MGKYLPISYFFQINNFYIGIFKIFFFLVYLHSFYLKYIGSTYLPMFHYDKHLFYLFSSRPFNHLFFSHSIVDRHWCIIDEH